MVSATFLVSLVFLSVVLGEAKGAMYPVLNPCNSTIIETIHNYWKETETPTNILKKMEEMGRYIHFHSSYEGLTLKFQCTFFDVKNNVIDFTLVPKDGSPPIKLDFKLTESGEGVLLGQPVDDPHIHWLWYPIHIGDGLYASYVCNKDRDTPKPLLGDVFAAANGSYNETLIKAKPFKDLLESWGFQFTYISHPECLTNGTKWDTDH